MPITPESSKQRSPNGGARLTKGFEVARWIETHAVFPDGEWIGRPFRLQPWQRELLLAMFETESSGLRRYRWALLGLSKKNGKSSLAAALALYFLIGDGEPAPLVCVCASSEDQADLVYGYARRMCELSPTLSLITECYEREILVPSITGARLRRLSAVAGANDGMNIHAVVLDELHEWTGPKGEAVFTVLTNSIGARRQPMILATTTAGFDRETPCFKLYEHGQKVAADPSVDPRFFFHWIEAPAGADHTDPEVWRAANPSYGVTVHEPFFADQLLKKPQNTFERYFLNRWTLSQQSWLPPGAWEACRGDVVIDDTTPTVVGCDMALKHDSVGVVWVQMHDGVAHVGSRVWDPRGDRIDVEAVENHIRTLHRELNVTEVTYDPAYFERSAQVLTDQGVPMVEFPQSPSRMVPACQGAYEAIVQQRLVHDGDPTLSDHVLSAAQRDSERGWTLSKGRSKRKIDAAIAMVIALREAAQPPEPASIYESRDLIILG